MNGRGAREPSLDQTDGATVSVFHSCVSESLMRRSLRVANKNSGDAVGDMHLAQRLHHRLHAVMVGGDGEHAKGLPSELPFVLFGGG